MGFFKKKEKTKITEKEKVYLHWYIMQPINKTEEEKIKEFSSLIRENSRIDDNYNIIFNA